VAAVDVNGDSRLDIIVANYGTNKAAVLMNNGTATFAPQMTYSAGTGPTFAVVADVNGDNIPDIIVANYAANNVGILMNNGTGAFAAQVTYSTSPGSAPFL
jgi:hypothetical protein